VEAEGLYDKEHK